MMHHDDTRITADFGRETSARHYEGYRDGLDPAAHAALIFFSFSEAGHILPIASMSRDGRAPLIADIARRYNRDSEATSRAAADARIFST